MSEPDDDEPPTFAHHSLWSWRRDLASGRAVAGPLTLVHTELGYRVELNGLCLDCLTEDEALWCVARFLLKPGAPLAVRGQRHRAT